MSKCWGLAACLALSQGALVDPLKHNVLALNARNLMDSFMQYRDRFPGAIVFYKNEAKVRTLFNRVLEPLAQEARGQLRIGAMDCVANLAACNAELDDAQWALIEGPDGFVLKLYPPPPAPSFVYTQNNTHDTHDTHDTHGKATGKGTGKATGKAAGKATGKKGSEKSGSEKSGSDKSVDRAGDKSLQPAVLKRTLLRMMPAAEYTKLRTVEEAVAFFAKDAGIPKVIYYSSDKTKPATIFTALAHTFGDRMTFCFIGKDSDPAVAAGLGIAGKSPNFAIKQRDVTFSKTGVETLNYNAAKPLAFHRIEEWLNNNGGEKPWLQERIPELTKLSARDVCFQQKAGFCAIFAVGNGATALPPNIQELLTSIMGQVTKPVLSFSWVNVDRELEVAEALGGLKPNSFTILNPHKRLRFTTVQNANKASAILGFLDKVKAGDGKFTPVKNNKMPAFASRSAIAKEEL